jgi:hypothetical protein
VPQFCAISRDWLDADFRIVFSKNRADETTGYARCLETLLGVLPLLDKDLHLPQAPPSGRCADRPAARGTRAVLLDRRRG